MRPGLSACMARARPPANAFLGPVVAPLDRHHQVQALAAGGAREALQTKLSQPLPQLVRRRDDTRERQALGRVEVEREPVRALRPVGAGTVRVQLDSAELDQPSPSALSIAR